MRIPLTAAPASAKECVAQAPKVVDVKCTVPAGTFDCKKTVTERAGTLATWTASGIPVPVRSVLTSGGMTSTTELTKMLVVRN
jgi:hypothetical protein